MADEVGVWPEAAGGGLGGGHSERRIRCQTGEFQDIWTNKKMKKGGSSNYHTTKDGRRVKKGLYYYMNRAKKRGTSKPGKGSVTDKALKRSAKTAKK